MNHRGFSGSRLAATASMLLLSLLFYDSALAQSGTSTLRGTVVDQQGNVVAGANVTLSNAEKNFTRSQTTNESGGYVFSAVPPGTYRVEIEATGFKKSSTSDVRAVIDTPVDLDVQLEAGSVTETITVTAGQDAPINSSDATIGNTFESRRIEELPLNARNIVGLLSLQPGVTSSGYVNGGRADQSNITLDGVDVNEQQAGLDVVATTVTGINQAFASVLRVTPDSVQEFRVVTTNPNADQGRSSGAQVSLVTKSGTNDLHGSLYHFHRNTVTTANDFFNNKAGVERPQLLRNIFGGSIGGPIKKDRAFFFFTYEGFREATGTGVAKVVPLASTIGQGIIRYQTRSGASDPSCPAGTPAGFRCLTPAQIDAAYLAANGVSPGTNAAAIAYLSNIARRYPANDTTVGDGINTGGFRFNARTPTTQDTYITKFDFNLTNRQTLFVRGHYQDDLVLLAPDLPDTTAPQIWNHPKGLALGHTWVVSDRVVNRITYGLTRAAFSQQGESSDPNVSFRFIFQPGAVGGITPARTLTRVTPVHNIVDDLSWNKGNHTLQFGGNLRFIRNIRSSFAGSYDFATTNPSGYEGSSAVLTTSTDNTPIFADVAQSSTTPLRNALSAFIGRFSEYSASIQYDSSGNILPPGSPAARTFATEEYEAYTQDSWRIRPNFTLSYGLRWSTSTPVYEANGFQVQPVQSLGEFFERRLEGMQSGVPYNELITLDKSGKANGRPGFYDQDWNNFAPSASFAWSPDFGDNFLGRVIGREGRSVIRGGFRMTYDRIGSQLAVSFDLNNSLGFNSAPSTSAGQFNVTDALPPRFTTLTPDVRTLPFIAGTFPTQLTFPLTEPADNSERIQSSLDDTITTPYNYSVNLSYGRELWKGLSFEVSFVGRFARDLLAQRDLTHFNNIRDPKSGITWYEAIRQLVDLRYAGAPITSVQPNAFFENLLPGIAGTRNINGVPTALTATQIAYRTVALPSVGGLNTTDYTFLQSNLRWNNRPAAIFDNTFVHPQYATLLAWSTIAKSNYNSGQLSVRQRFNNDLTFDFNYTLSNSHDNASGLQNATFGSTTSLIFDPTNPDSNYANSDFDVRHIINANWLYGLPIGRGKALLGDLPSVANAVLGGWQMTGIFRWNSGFPTAALRPFAFQRWATNWQISSGMVATRPVESSPGDVNGEPNLFADPQAAFESYRDPLPGEPGDRNKLRYPGYFSLDAGLHKTFNMPWENHRLTFRWEVYNVTNTQRLTGFSGTGLPTDPFVLGGNAPTTFGRFTATQTPLNETKAGRSMQFALRYAF
ncbi:MAG: TonB-dependent receptor [Acidobacteriota bacterium]|nr:TonB-dependent receptor [Acidobacteriota bacterium]